MSPSVTCYAQRSKPKSQRVLEAFAAGAGGRVVETSAQRLEAGAAAFYGVRPAWRHLWDEARADGRDWFYLDNAWFDAGRERFFRVGVNALQSWSQEPSDGRRLRELGVKVRDRDPDVGEHIVVCRQSDEFMRCAAGWQGGMLGWQEDVLNELKRHTDRLIVVRQKGADKPLEHDLHRAHCLVTHSSAAAVEALISGVPVIVTDHECAAARFGMKFEQLERGRALDPDEIAAWAARLADSQWTLDELRSGAAWKAIRGRRCAKASIGKA